MMMAKMTMNIMIMMMSSLDNFLSAKQQSMSSEKSNRWGFKRTGGLA